LRRPYIDWLRGVAVLTMIEWHVLDAWSVRAGRARPTWTVIETIGGFAAPLFLFLAGVAIPFAIAAKQRRGESVGAAAWSVQKRGWEVFGIAHLFRFQSFLLNPTASWSSIFRPDILNILGLGLAGTSWLSGRLMRQAGRRGPRRSTGSSRSFVWLLVPAVVIFALTPMSRVWSWPADLPGRLEAYIRPGNGLGVFQIFPWAGYVPFGAFLGSVLLGARNDAEEHRVLLRIMAGGAIAAAFGAVGYFLDPNGPLVFWAGPYTSLLMRTGVMAAALAASKWVVAAQPASLLAPIILFGQTSLFIYIVHVELAYGVWSLPLHGNLPLAWSLAALAGVYVAMYFAATWWAQRPVRPWIPEQLRAAAEVRSSKYEVRKQAGSVVRL
jgi:uncharacterized membrane protein